MKVRSLIILIILWVLICAIAPADIKAYPVSSVLILIVFCIYGACDQWWQALRFEGKHILADLQREKGHTTYHPEDLPNIKEKDGKGFRVVSTRGFSAGELSFHGDESFIVFPPEHLKILPKGAILYTTLRKIKFDWLPRDIQEKLFRLKLFSLKSVEKKENLYFGMCSEKLGTATDENKAYENLWLEENAAINEILSKLREKAKEVPDSTWGEANE